AAVEVGLDPAIDIAQAVRHHPPLFAEPGVDRSRVAALESLDDHEEHVGSYCGGTDGSGSLLFASGSVRRRTAAKMPKPTMIAVTPAPRPARTAGTVKSFVPSAMIQARPRPQNAIQAHASAGAMLTL